VDQPATGGVCAGQGFGRAPWGGTREPRAWEREPQDVSPAGEKVSLGRERRAEQQLTCWQWVLRGDLQVLGAPQNSQMELKKVEALEAAKSALLYGAKT